MPDGTTINAAVDAKSFDQAIVDQGIELPDRENWPTYHRCMVLSQCEVPIMYIPAERVPEHLRAKFEAVKPKEEEGVTSEVAET